MSSIGIFKIKQPARVIMYVIICHIVQVQITTRRLKAKLVAGESQDGEINVTKHFH